MSYLRTLSLTLAAGFIGYVNRESQKEKQLDDIFEPNPHYRINEYLRSLYLSVATRISEYFYKSILVICRNNFFFDVDENVDQFLEYTPFHLSSVFYGKDGSERKTPAIPLKFPYDSVQVEEHTEKDSPTFNYFKIPSSECIFFCDTRTRTPYWMMEKVTKDNVDEVAHRHGEEFIPTVFLKKTFRFGNCRNKERFKVYSIQFPILQTITKENGEIETQCDYCVKTPVRKTFHEYIKFLTELYDEVKICSGTLFLINDQHQTQLPNGYRQKEAKKTHFFKALLCKNPDGTYRVECYRFEYDDETEEPLSLATYLTPLEDLEKQTGFAIYSKSIPKTKIVNTQTHVNFLNRRWLTPSSSNNS